MKCFKCEFLNSHDPKLRPLARSAGANFADDLNSTLTKMRQFGELLASHVAAKAKLVLTVDRFGFSMIPNRGMIRTMRKGQSCKSLFSQEPQKVYSCRA